MNENNNTPENRRINSELDRILNESANSIFESTRNVAESSSDDGADPTLNKAKTEINAQADSMLREIEERRQRRAARQRELEQQIKAEDEAKIRRNNRVNSQNTIHDSVTGADRIRHSVSDTRNYTPVSTEALNRFSSAPSQRTVVRNTQSSAARRRRSVASGETQIMPKVTESKIPSQRERSGQAPERRSAKARTSQRSAAAPSQRTSSSRSPQRTVRSSNKNSKEVNIMKEIREWAIAIVIAVVVSLLIRNFVFTLVKVQGESMMPTLQNNDRLYVNRFFYSPQKGDVVIFKPASDPDRPYIKRVIATEGDTVFIDFETGDVYVNGNIIDEPYIKDRTTRSGEYINGLIANGQYSKDNPIVVEKNKIFVMGDNRNNSKDSRMIGQVPEDELIGGAVFRFWPLGHFGSVSYDMSYLIEDENNNYIVVTDEAA